MLTLTLSFTPSENEPAIRYTAEFKDEWISLDALAWVAYAIADQVTSRVCTINMSSCKKGCGICCQQLVTVSAAEAVLLTRHLGKRWETRVLNAISRLELAGLGKVLEMLGHSSLSNEDHYRLAKIYFDYAVPCPFQGDDGACQIYTIRPTLCRDYLVASSPCDCQDPFHSPPRRLLYSLDVHEALLGVCSQLLKREIEPIALPMAMKWVELHPQILLQHFKAKTVFELFEFWMDVTMRRV